MEDWREEALEWARGTWSLDQIQADLESSFGMPRKRNSLRNLLTELGIKPAIKYGSPRTGEGRSGYYDQLLCHVIYTAYSAVDVNRAVLARRLDDYRDIARKAIWGRLAHTPKKRREYLHLAWDWRVESTAYHLFISDTRHGLHPRELHALLAPRPQLLYRTLDANTALESVLRGYIARYVGEFSGLIVDPNEVNLFAGTRRPVFGNRIESADTLEILRQFSLLEPDGRRLSEPNHVHVDEPDIYSEGEYAPR